MAFLQTHCWKGATEDQYRTMSPRCIHRTGFLQGRPVATTFATSLA